MYPDTRDDAEAIFQAIINGRTGRLNGRGGMGFASVKTALEPVNGVLTIRSGKGLGVYDPVKAKLKIYRRSANYPGTQILFKIKLDK